MNHAKRALLIVLSMFIAVSVFAQLNPRPPHPGGDNARMTAQGTIRSLEHERDGYRIKLQGNEQSFFVPDYVVRDRVRDFRVGASIRIGGFFRRGLVYVDVVEWLPGDRYRERQTIRGEITRIDPRNDFLYVRDLNTGRVIRADLSNYSRPYARRMSRGDIVTLYGTWSHEEGHFDVDRIERSRR